MTRQQINREIEICKEAIGRAGDRRTIKFYKDRISKLELAREYFHNPAFRSALEQFTWDLNNRYR